MQEKRETFSCWMELYPCSAPGVWQALFYTQTKLILNPTRAGRKLATERLPFTQQLSPGIKASLTRLHRTRVSLHCMGVRSSRAIPIRAIAPAQHLLTDAESESASILHESYQIC